MNQNQGKQLLTTIERPITESEPVRLTRESANSNVAFPEASAWTFPRSPMCRFSSAGAP